jgi:hypothetical protein
MEVGGTHAVSIDVDISIDIDITIDIDIDIMAAPAPGPPTPAPDRSNGYGPPEPKPNADANCHTGPNRGIHEGRICGIPPGSVDNNRIVTGHIDNFRICRFDFVDFAFDDHLLLGARLQIAGSISFRPQFLNRVHYIGLLSYEGFTHPLSPFPLLSHHCEYLWKRRQRFNAQVPGHSIQGRIERIPLEGRICLHPAVSLHNLIGVCCSDQDLCEQRIRI